MAAWLPIRTCCTPSVRVWQALLAKWRCVCLRLIWRKRNKPLPMVCSRAHKMFLPTSKVLLPARCRQYHGETDADVATKAQRALAAGITPIVCVGETLAEREAGQTQAVVKRQLAAVIQTNGHCISEIVVAYEPVWAIGTGQTATPEQAQAVHALLRAQLAAATAHPERIALLYGGSMNAANAASLLAQNDIDGGLIGGASLKATDFLTIVAAASH